MAIHPTLPGEGEKKELNALFGRIGPLFIGENVRRIYASKSVADLISGRDLRITHNRPLHLLGRSSGCSPDRSVMLTRSIGYAQCPWPLDRHARPIDR